MTTKTANPRHAIYDALGFNEHQRKTFEKQLRNDLDRLRPLYKIDPNLPKEKAKTAILEAYKANQEESDRKHAERMAARSKHFDAFHRIFKVSLSRFWSHPLFGFDVIAFDEFIKPNENESCAQAVQRLHGDEALKMIQEFLAH